MIDDFLRDPLFPFQWNEPNVKYLENNIHCFILVLHEMKRDLNLKISFGCLREREGEKDREREGGREREREK